MEKGKSGFRRVYSKLIFDDAVIAFYKMQPCSLDYLPENTPYLLWSFAVIAALDVALYLSGRNKSRWFKLHVLANLCTVIFSYSDFVTVISDPLKNYSGTGGSLIPTNMTLALHLYHAFAFNNLKMVDWAHHIIMMTILTFILWCPHTQITNSVIFVTNGLPGGIDYFLLILVKDGIINRVTEKRINSKLNIWIRGPLILIAAYVVYLQWRYNITGCSFWVTFSIIAALYWNAQYFTERVVYNWGNASDEGIPPLC